MGRSAARESREMWPRGMKGGMWGVERGLPPILRAESESGLFSEG